MVQGNVHNEKNYQNSALKLLCEEIVPYSMDSSYDYVVKNNSANIYLFKVNNKNTRKRCEISSKLTITTPKQRH